MPKVAWIGLSFVLFFGFGIAFNAILTSQKREQSDSEQGDNEP